MSDVEVHGSETTDVVVVGGGLAGLTAAATAARAGRRVVVLDAQRLGGRAAVQRRNGFAFNRGPRALYLGGRGRQVLDGLGVATDRGGKPAPKGAMGRRRGKLGLLPASAGSLLRSRLLPASEKPAFARVFARLHHLRPSDFTGMTADEAVGSLRLGPVGVEVVTAVTRVATYTAATDVLDGPATIRQLQLAVGDGVIYLDGGWQTLVDALEARAVEAGATIRTGERVKEVADSEGAPVVVTAGGGRIRASQVVIAAGGPDAAASLLGLGADAWPQAGPPVVAACLELGLRRPPSTRVIFGIDEPLYLSTHCPPADLAPPGHAVVHVMRYTRHDEDLPAGEVRPRLERLAHAAGITESDVVESRFLARMVVTGAIPTAEAGGLAGRIPVEGAGRPGVLLAGDWVGDEGLIGDAALASGARAGRLAAERSGTLAVA